MLQKVLTVLYQCLLITGIVWARYYLLLIEYERECVISKLLPQGDEVLCKGSNDQVNAIYLPTLSSLLDKAVFFRTFRPQFVDSYINYSFSISELRKAPCGITIMHFRPVNMQTILCASECLATKFT